MKENKEEQINGKIICYHELEELMLKYQYYKKAIIDSIQSLSKIQWQFF